MYGSFCLTGLDTTGLEAGISIGRLGLEIPSGRVGLSGLAANLPGLEAVKGLRPQLLA